MSPRGKCQACGIYASLGNVRLQVRGRVVNEAELCRRCACDVEDAVRKVLGEISMWATAKR